MLWPGWTPSQSVPRRRGNPHEAGPTYHKEGEVSNLTVQRLGPEAQADSGFDDHDYEAKRFVSLDVRPANERAIRKEEILAYGVVLGVAWLILMAVLGLLAWLNGPESYETPSGWYVLFAGLFGLVAASPVLLGIGSAGLKLYNSYHDAQVRRLRGSLVRDKWMNPVDARLVSGFDPAQYAGIWRASADVEVAVAPYRQLRGVEAYSPSNSIKNDAGATAAALPDNGSLRVMGAGEVIELLNGNPDDHPHTFIYGASGSGKTTFARALIAPRDGFLLVLDPKAEGPNKWGGLPYVTVNEEGDFRPLRRATLAVLEEFKRRNAANRAGRSEDWPVLTVMVDEFFTALAAVPDLGDLLKRVSSVGRSLRIRLVLMSQSNRVKASGLEGLGDLRENLTTVFLGRWATDEVPEAAQYAVNAKKAGVLMDGADPVVIDTREVPALAASPLRATLWRPDGVSLEFLGPQAADDTLAELLGLGSGPSVGVDDDEENRTDDQTRRQTVAFLAGLKRQGYSRRRVRAEYPEVAFDNAMWTDACVMVGDGDE